MIGDRIRVDEPHSRDMAPSAGRALRLGSDRPVRTTGGTMSRKLVVHRWISAPTKNKNAGHSVCDIEWPGTGLLVTENRRWAEKAGLTLCGRCWPVKK